MKFNVPLKAIVFVFQELRDDMPSVLADVFCILGKPAVSSYMLMKGSVPDSVISFVLVMCLYERRFCYVLE